MKKLFALVFCLLLVQAAVALTDLGTLSKLCADANAKVQVDVKAAATLCASINLNVLGISLGGTTTVQARARIQAVADLSAGLFVEIHASLLEIACLYNGNAKFLALVNAVVAAELQVHAKIGACIGLCVDVKVLGGLVSAGLGLSAQVEVVANVHAAAFAQIESAIQALSL